MAWARKRGVYYIIEDMMQVRERGRGENPETLNLDVFFCQLKAIVGNFLPFLDPKKQFGF